MSIGAQRSLQYRRQQDYFIGEPAIWCCQDGGNHDHRPMMAPCPFRPVGPVVPNTPDCAYYHRHELCPVGTAEENKPYHAGQCGDELASNGCRMKHLAVMPKNGGIERYG